VRVVFASTTRYPTEKAYGIATQETCRAASEEGLDSLIATVGDGMKDNVGNRVYGIRSRSIALARKISNKSIPIVSPLAFTLQSILFGSRLATDSFVSDAEIIWMRDPIACFVANLRGYKGCLVLEMHHVPHGLNASAIKSINRSKRIILTTLTSHHAELIGKRVPGARIVVAPMAVPNKFFQDPIRKKLSKVVTIGFIGKSTSSGQDNGLKTLLDVAKRLQELKCPARIQLVGIESDAIKELALLRDALHVDGAYFEVLGHISHGDVRGLLSNFNVGLLPYPNTPYNDGRFPIKVLEYAAAGCIIFASDTPVHHRIMGDNLAKYYECGSVDSLVALIIDYIEKPDEYKLQQDLAYEWAKQFTYRHRVKAVLSEFRYRESSPLL
jgi:glycosyltransferase involved in cell wall biosynthesis